MRVQDLAKRYEAGTSQDLLGAELGLSGNGVRYRLQRFYGKRYDSIVTKVLMLRITHARTHAKRRPSALKHALAVLRRVRPALYQQHLERTKPIACSACARPIQAQLMASMWRWSCAWCGENGRCLAFAL